MALGRSRQGAAPLRPLVGVVLLVLGHLSRTCAASDATLTLPASALVSPAPVPAPATVHEADGEAVKAAREQAAPAAAAPLDSTAASSTPTYDDDDDEDLENETLVEDSGVRRGRFIHWGSGSRGALQSPQASIASFSHRAAQLGDILKRAAKFLSAFASSQEEDAANNEVDVDEAQRKEDSEEQPQDDDSPGAALSGLYTECLLRLSVPCVQRKLLLFLDRLGRMERFRLLGDFLTVVRVEPRHGEARRHVLDEEADVTDLAGMVDRLVDDFFDTHVLRFSLPGTLRVGRSPRTTVDIHLDHPGGPHDGDEDDDDAEHGRSLGGVIEARGSLGSFGGGGGNSKKKMKMIKKIKKKLMKLLMMMMSVMMVMGPMTGGMAGNTAGMALMLGTLALIILKAMLIKQMGGSVTQLMSNVGNSFGNLAGIPGLPGSQGQNTNYFPTGSGSSASSGSGYARSDYVYQPYTNYNYNAWMGRALADEGSWFSGMTDPLSLAYRAYSIASKLK